MYRFNIFKLCCCMYVSYTVVQVSPGTRFTSPTHFPRLRYSVNYFFVNNGPPPPNMDIRIGPELE